MLFSAEIDSPLPRAALHELGAQLAIGDLIFIRIPLLPFRKVAETTASWVNHVGIVVETADGKPVIAESRVLLSGQTSWQRFIARSEARRVAVARLREAPCAQEKLALRAAARKRYGILYDTGFNLHSRRQFCSRYVREVVSEATGIVLGEVVDFASLLERYPQADLAFWRLWYLGAIPWRRETVTPASLLQDASLEILFDGYAGRSTARPLDALNI